MKINEKNLSYFATSLTLVDKEGYLTKQGEINRAAQRRWFVLKGNLLFYFEKQTDKEPVGVIILEGCTIELAENVEDAFTFKIMFHGPNNRSYILGAENQESMEQWMKALACASYDYMKLMVAELQRQLDELDGPIVNESPQVPARRQNPFNKQNPSTSSHPISLQHSHTLSDIQMSSSSSPSHSIINHNINIINKNKISFRELHSLYGRPILLDKNEYLYKQKQKLKDNSFNDEQPLISL